MQKHVVMNCLVLDVRGVVLCNIYWVYYIGFIMVVIDCVLQTVSSVTKDPIVKVIWRVGCYVTMTR